MAKPKHHVTGLRLYAKGDKFDLTALTKSPRGTQIPFTSTKGSGIKGPADARQREIRHAIDKLLGKEIE